MAMPDVYSIFFILTCVHQSSAILRSPPLMMKQPPKELAFSPYRSLTLECEASGEPPPKYRWTKNGLDLQLVKNRIIYLREGATLLIIDPTYDDSGQYQCFAENEWGTATSDSAYVRIGELNDFKQLKPMTLDVREGDPFKLSCDPPDGWPKPTVKWMMKSRTRRIEALSNPRLIMDPNNNLWFSNVTREDAEEEYNCEVLLSVVNEYKYSDYFKLNVMSEKPKKQHRPVKQYVTRRKAVAYRGGDVDLYCIYGGTPLPEVLWRKDGETLQFSDRIIRNNFGRSIKIEDVSFDDKGAYTCEVSNGVGQAKSYSFNLEILASPFFTIEPEPITNADGEDVELRCEASGNPEPTIQWIQNGKPIAETSPDGRRTVSKNSIVIKRLMMQDIGNYGCNATNHLGYIYKDVYINVLALPPEMVSPPAAELLTVTGRKETLKCRVTGSPPPVIIWKKGGIELNDSRYTVASNGDLIIDDVQFQDAGKYTCLARNKFGEIFADAVLIVRERTRITVKPDDYTTIAGRDATFRCQAIADPKLNLTIEWVNSAQPLYYERFVHTNDSLTIGETTARDSGNYTCVASTQVDEDRATATLVVQYIPNPPLIVGVECREKEAHIEWKSRGDNHSPITHYSIEFSTSWTLDTPWYMGVDNISSDVLSYNVPMRPWAKYAFRVKAHNLIGPSKASYHFDVCNTQPDVPYKNPDGVQGKGTEPNNLLISWNPMPEIDHNGPKLRYKVFWKQNITGVDWNTMDVYNWTRSSIVLYFQPTYKPYLIKVIAINEKGPSKAEPVETIGYSGEDIPTEAPGNFTVTQIVSKTSAMFSWSPVPPESLRGRFAGYKIQIWTDEKGESDMVEKKISSQGNAFLATDLVPSTKNYARIFVFNDRFNGPPSETLVLNTTESTTENKKG